VLGGPWEGDSVSDEFVPEAAIDYDEVFRRGGQNWGDEDFDLFRCPNCGHIYLLEYEVDTVYLDADDLTKRAAVFLPQRSFCCVTCAQQVPEGAWCGPRAERRFRVTWAELKASRWAWVVKPAK